MKHASFTLLAFVALISVPLHAQAGVITLGTADDFAVLAGTTVTNTGASVIQGGGVGVSPGSAITGFLSAAVRNGTTFAEPVVPGRARSIAGLVLSWTSFGVAE